MPINDGEWHSVKWTISNSLGQLFVDNTLIGSITIEDCTLNTAPPFYYGGTNPTDYAKVIELIVRILYKN